MKLRRKPPLPMKSPYRILPMKKYLALLFGLAALLLVGWYGYRGLVEQQSGFPLPPLKAAEVEKRLPTRPEDWQGNIDYRGLDRDFAVLAARPEMAGLAVAIVEDGDLRFVGTYGVTTSAPESGSSRRRYSAGPRYQKAWRVRWPQNCRKRAGLISTHHSTAGRPRSDFPAAQSRG